MKPTHFLPLIFAAIVTVSCTTDKSEIVIDLNESIHHDDFEYSVRSYSIEKNNTNPESSIGDKVTYLVSFQVVNNAKRVYHPWDNSVAYLVDENGSIYENQTDAQKLLNLQKPFGWQESYVTASRSSDSTILVFEIPKSIKHPYLMVRGKTLMGDFFDGDKFKRTKIKLFE